MSRGLGALQRDIKGLLARTVGLVRPLRFADLRGLFIVHYGGDPKRGDKLTPTQERSLKRALKGLVDRGDVLIVSGSGGQRDPHRYMTVEAFATQVTGEGKDTADAKRFVADMAAVAQGELKRLSGD
jgi:hypothetical protein